jgi:hypothetical protein
VDYFTVRNTVILALVQVGVIVAGVLGAGAAHKWYAPMGVRVPALTTFVADYGFLALGLPVAWVTVALLVLKHEPESAAPAWLVVASGLLLLVLLLIGVWQASGVPLLRLMSL